MDKLNGVNWLTNNILPIALTLVTWAAAFGVMNTKIDYLIEQNKEMKLEFRNWRTQWEERLGQAELNIAVLQK